jgi:two-component system, OmpR family, phosphate regulon sensor histidine kinase PhoR
MSVTRKFGGTGLGLNIVKQLVTSHGGTITCDSTVGIGTSFTINLPVLQRGCRQSLEEQVSS